MRVKIFLLSLLAILGVSFAPVSAEMPPGFKDSNFSLESGYPNDLPEGWIYRLEEGGYQLVNTNDDTFFAGIGLVINDYPKTLDPEKIREQVLENMKLTPEERASVICLPSETLGKNGEYKVAGFWMHKKNGDKNPKDPYMALLFFGYQGEPHYFFAMDKTGEENLAVNARGLFKAIFEGAPISAEEVKEVGNK